MHLWLHMKAKHVMHACVKPMLAVWLLIHISQLVISDLSVQIPQ
jgi:hypothetical protein